MKTKRNSLVTLMAVVAALLALAPTMQARGRAGGGGMHMSAPHFSNAGARPQRHGADDPPNHHRKDDRGHHHRHHHHHRPGHA